MSCGTVAGYRHHHRAGETVCASCHHAQYEYGRSYRAGERRRIGGRNRDSAPTAILALLDQYGQVGAPELAAFITAAPGTIQRAMYRLITAGEIVKDGQQLRLKETP